MFRPLAIILIVLFIDSLFANVSAQVIEIDQPLAVLQTDSELNQLMWHPNGEILAVASDNGVKLYTSTLQLITQIHQGDFIYSLSWSPNGNQLALTYETTIEIWNWDQTLDILTLSDTLQGINRQVVVSWSANSERLASIGILDLTNDTIGRFEIWDTASWELELVTSDLYGFDSLLPTSGWLRWNPNGDLTILGFGNAVREQNGKYFNITNFIVYVLDIETDTRVQEISPKANSAYAVAWHLDGNFIGVANQGGVGIYDASTGEFIRQFSMLGYHQTVAWSPNGHYLAADTAMADFVEGQNLGLFSPVLYTKSIDWNPDGVRLAIAHYDGSIYIEDATLLPGFVPPSPTPTLSITPMPN